MKIISGAYESSGIKSFNNSLQKLNAEINPAERFTTTTPIVISSHLPNFHLRRWADKLNPVFVLTHGIQSTPLKTAYDAQFYRERPNITILTINRELEAQCIQWGVNHRHVDLWVDDAEDTAEGNNKGNDFDIFIGHDIPRKRPELAAEIQSEIRPRKPLRRFGNGFEFLPHGELMDELKKARYLVIASESEGRSIATLEAVTRGVAVVADDVSNYAYLNEMSGGVTACAAVDELDRLSSPPEIAAAAREYNERARSEFKRIVCGGGG